MIEKVTIPKSSSDNNPEKIDPNENSNKLFSRLHAFLLEDENSPLKSDLFVNTGKTKETIRLIIDRIWGRRNNSIKSLVQESAANADAFVFSISLNEAVTALFNSKIFAVSRLAQKAENAGGGEELIKLNNRLQELAALQNAAIQEIEEWYKEESAH